MWLFQPLEVSNWVIRCLSPIKCLTKESAIHQNPVSEHVHGTHVWIQLLHLSHKHGTTQYIVEIYPSESALYLIQSRYLHNDTIIIFIHAPINIQFLNLLLTLHLLSSLIFLTLTRVHIDSLFPWLESLKNCYNVKIKAETHKLIQRKSKVSNFSSTTITCFFHYFQNFSFPQVHFQSVFKDLNHVKSQKQLTFRPTVLLDGKIS